MGENDVFISYASPDDRPLSEGQEGWVRSFERLLRDHLVTFRGGGDPAAHQGDQGEAGSGNEAGSLYRVERSVKIGWPPSTFACA